MACRCEFRNVLHIFVFFSDFFFFVKQAYQTLLKWTPYEKPPLNGKGGGSSYWNSVRKGAPSKKNYFKYKYILFSSFKKMMRALRSCHCLTWKNLAWAVGRRDLDNRRLLLRSFSRGSGRAVHKRCDRSHCFKIKKKTRFCALLMSRGWCTGTNLYMIWFR